MGHTFDDGIVVNKVVSSAYSIYLNVSLKVDKQFVFNDLRDSREIGLQLRNDVSSSFKQIGISFAIFILSGIIPVFNVWLIYNV